MQVQDYNNRYAGWRESGKLHMAKGAAIELLGQAASTLQKESRYTTAVYAMLFNDDGSPCIDSAQSVVQRARVVMEFLRNWR